MDLAKQFRLTYLDLRVGLAAVSLCLPVVLVVGGGLMGVPSQATLSNYYFAELPPGFLRTAFVGMLGVLGAMLWVYRGYTEADNRIHNAAGVAALAVAIFPMECPFAPGDPSHALCIVNSPKVHYPAAIALFSLALVSIYYGGGRTFLEVATSRAPRAVKTFYRARWASAVFIASGLASAVVILLAGYGAEAKSWVWLLESFGFWGFGSYWLALTRLIKKVDAATEPALAPSAAVQPAVA